ncbi:uncharacterized protein LAJ45_00486 [Morchella importuna]|uniref:PAS domain-containing protein n=1 Tax=Morchella conica CCBAS932 TaxID=1392247 RepID=A0A3N4L0Y8_9PEZI|nr:uncharacterized protein LAJ45_00486 [Morchella importuna]KAH8155476.1 hypothetical protein LAJ45_00486 [Morchella importuna]RPB16477.1 hypothetical protein P167DRAFT_481224 [Morchella conica CCBAS932]
MAGPGTAGSKASRKKAAPPALPRCTHLIQFYEAECFLYDAVSKFILPSFFSTENAAIIIATRQHLDGLEAHLREQNLAPGLLKERGQLILVDADALLPSLLNGDKVDGQAFDSYFGKVFQDVRKQYPRILAYGELVNILCERGSHLLAHELEQVWERFLAVNGKDASLLCGYDMSVFEADGLSDVFQQICLSHSHVVPGEKKYPLLGDSQDRDTIVAMLQQQTRCLEAEVVRRKISESALQSTLEHFSAPAIETHTQPPDPNGHHSSVPVGICGRTSFEGRHQYFVNERFCELSGLHDYRIRQDGNWLSAVHHLDRERVSRFFSFEDGRLRKQDYRFVHPNGDVRWVSAEFTVNVYGYVHTIVDITNSRNHREQQAQAGRSNMVNNQMVQNGGIDYPSQQNQQHQFTDPYHSSGDDSNGSYTENALRRSDPQSPDESLQTISSEQNRRMTADRIRNEFENIARLLSDISKDDSLSQHSFNFATIKTHMEKLQAWYSCLPSPLALHLVILDHSIPQTQKAVMLQAYCAYLRSVIILTRRVLLKVANTATRSKCPQENGSLEVFYANKCISAARGLCKVLDMLFEGDKQQTKGWLTISSAFTACVIVFLDISLRPVTEPPIIDDIADIIPKCINTLKSSPRPDHQTCKQYLETLIPFWMALKPPIPSDSHLGRILPLDQASPQAWLALDNQWTNKWSLGQALNTTDDLLEILREPCGGVDHKDWIARSWDWRFLLPADASAAQNTDSTSTITKPPWNNNGTKRKAKRSKAEDESSNHSQSSHS